MEKLKGDKKMMDDFHLFCRRIREKLLDRVNGVVVFDLIMDSDAAIFYINFKDFHYKYVVTDLSTIMKEDGNSEKMAGIIEKKYKKCVNEKFFKTDFTRYLRQDRVNMESILEEKYGKN